jgi:hypothetical protein
MDARSLTQHGGRKPDAMQTLMNPALAEQESGTASGHLVLARADDLLQARGYELVDRFGHIHARRNTQELHVCLVADLASMSPSRFLACLDEAIEQSVEHVLALSLHM